jgi:transposase
MPQSQAMPSIVVGIDTHKDVHVAVALDDLGGWLGSISIAANQAGYRRLERWAVGLGTPMVFGVEGTGCHGAALARHLSRAGYQVREINRPDRTTRRRRGKSDPIDAESAARAVLAGTATVTPKTGAGAVEMIRMLKLAKDSATKARTQALNQLQAVLVTAPPAVREPLTGLSRGALLDRCLALRPGALTSPAAVARHTLRLLAGRCRAPTDEIDQLRANLEHLTAKSAPALADSFAVGPDSAATLLITAGDNPERLRSEAAFAALCGTSPIPASSGKTNRHRLNRGGDRRANAALHRIAVVRLRWHQPTRDYMARRLAEGKTKAEIIRCIKRYLARELYHTMCSSTPDDPPGATA